MLDSLTKVFTSVAEGKIGNAILWGAFGAVMLYVGLGVGMGIEGLQLNAFHDPSNLKAKAFSMWMDDNFGFINDITGLSGDGGMLSLLDSQLEPYMADLQPIPEDTFDAPLDLGLSADDFLLG
ncbi:MAG: hypothetical protein ACRBCT_02180 [Alphaproteobacteria bacterium]